MLSEAVKLEREKRKTAREERVWSLLSQPEVLAPLVGVGGAVVIQKLGQSRVINRDYGGFLLAAWVAMTAAKAGITDKYALGALTGAAAAAYSISTPPTSEEAIIEFVPSKLLGGDGKLFGMELPFIPSDW